MPWEEMFNLSISVHVFRVLGVVLRAGSGLLFQGASIRKPASQKQERKQK